MWKSHAYPTHCCTATVLASVKPHRPPTLMGSFPPIALTSCARKLLEKIVTIQLIRWLEAAGVLNSAQFSYRELKRTTDALLRLQSHLVYDGAVRDQKLCVFFDLVKAYDTLPVLFRILRPGVHINTFCFGCLLTKNQCRPI
ncbi:hypothetical protein FHG87_005960 [Trinorchestia longiramus]|nr:hypothetical protein FHG87_005960 [Trinorchestia longiramus]